VKKLALLAIGFLVLFSVFVLQHEWLHQDVAKSYGCDASPVQVPSLEDLSDYEITSVPIAYVTYICDDPESRQQVQKLQLIVEIVGYQVGIVFIIVAASWLYQLHEFEKLSKSLKQIERNQEVLLQEIDVQQVDVRGENHRS
jgi:hypothetical protein